MSDFVGDVFGGVADAVGGVVDAVSSNLGTVASIASFAFPPIAPFVAAYNGLNALSQGNLIGAALGGYGAYGGFGGDIGGGSLGDYDVGQFVGPTQDYSALSDVGWEGPLQFGGDYGSSAAGGLFNSGGGYASDSSGLFGGSLPEGGAYANIPNAATQGGGIFDQGGFLGQGGLGSSLLTGGLKYLGGQAQARQNYDAAQQLADAQRRASITAADASKFRPVGVTTRFGTSKFGYDQNGNLVDAGYTLSPQIGAQQDLLSEISDRALSQYALAQNQTQPLSSAAQTLFGLGQNYLSTDPVTQANKYMMQQQALLASPRATDLANINSRLNAQGRSGLAVGGDAGMMAANPELNAYYNANRQQDLGLAANATQGGMDYTKFGAGLVGTGSDLLNAQYQTQSNAYSPYSTALGGVQRLEGLGQNALDQGITLGGKTSAYGQQAGSLLAQGITGSAQAMNQANQYSPWAGLLSGAADAIGNYQNPQQQPRFDAFTGRAL